MPTRITATFTIQSWEESNWHEGADGRKLTRASMRYRYSGDLEGESQSESLMCYRNATWASYVGLEHFTGRLKDRTGSFVLQGTGIFENGVATTTAHVVAGSGTDGFRGLRGEFHFEAGHKDRYPITFEYDFEEEKK